MGKLVSKIFGGMNSNATALNIADNEAESIVNWDIGLNGSITRRLGCSLKANLGTPFCLLGKFNKTDGTEVFVAVAGAKIWRSTDMTTWEDVTGSVTITATTGYIGEAFQSKFYVANGTDKPFYVGATGNASTIEAGSIITPIATCRCTPVGANVSGTLVYCVTAVTPRGETSPSGVTAPTNNNPNGTTAYNTISWVPAVGASSHRIYVCCTNTTLTRGSITIDQGKWALIGETDGTSSSYDDAIVAFSTNSSGLPIYVPTQNTAYLTPNDWNVNGQPAGFKIISRGRDERMLAWRGNTVWASGLSNPLNWLTPNDAFIWTISAGRDNRISAIGNTSV